MVVFFYPFFPPSSSFSKQLFRATMDRPATEKTSSKTLQSCRLHMSSALSQGGSFGSF